MAGRIEIGINSGVRDVTAEQMQRRMKAELGKDAACSFIEAYSIDADLSEQELEKLAKEVFTDSVIQHFSYRECLQPDSWRVEIGFLPGVTDNVGKTAKEAIADALGKDVDVYYSRIYALKGTLDEEDCGKIAGMVHNPLVEKYVLRQPGSPSEPYIPKVMIQHEPNVEHVSLHMSEARWMQLSKERTLALGITEFRAIQRHFKGERVQEQRKEVGLDSKITDVELELLAQTWSEHCKHRIFNADISYLENGDTTAINSLFNTFIRGATEQIKKPYVVSVFKDNGGIIKFNHEYDIAVKVETHNAPSALDPYGGALTGVLGVQRDVLGTGLGANPIANLDVLCFGLLDETEVPKGSLHPRRIYDGVTKGVEHGGNKMGIPTVNGSIIFDRDFTCRPLVYCGTIGIMPSKIGERRTSEKQISPGDLAVMAGGRIGKDGIHGATFSSQQIDQHTPQSVVQIGDPITQKKMLDFVLEARDALLYNAITDNGAGGLSSSVGELAQLSGGCEIYLDKCPLKYPGLDPWEILVSESQERMTLAVPSGNMEKLTLLAQKHGVEISVVGKFTSSRKLHAFYRDKTVAYMDLKFLHDGVPQYKLEAEWKIRPFPEPQIKETDLGVVLKMLLSTPNITTKEPVIRRYDHEVKGESIIKPLMRGPSDAAVIKPLYNSWEGLAISHGICPKFVQDSYAMSSLAFDEAVRNAVAVGAKFGYLACLDNFSWPDPVKSEKTPDGEFKLAQLVRACLALYDCATTYGIPIISGKDSMKNDYYSGDRKYSIPPTLLITVIGKLDDVRKAVTSEFKTPGDAIYVLGMTRDELGGSEYYRLFGGVGNNPPKAHPNEHTPIYRALGTAMEAGLVASAHDVSDGGAAVALAESAIGGDVGADLDISLMPRDTEKEDALIFSESPGRFVVSVAEANCARFETTMKGCICAKVGRVRGDHRVIIRKEDKPLVNALVEDLRVLWNNGPEKSRPRV
jgi:phosphoribosylformylglycinamidine synthase